MGSSRLLLVFAVSGCTAVSLAEDPGDRAAGRPLEDCSDGDCASPSPEAAVAHVVGVDERDDGGFATDDEDAPPFAVSAALPEEPSLRARRDEAESVGTLRRELAPLRDTDPSKATLLLRLAYAHAAQGDDFAMKETFLRIVREYPTSPVVPTVYAALGDHYYDAGEHADAGLIYERVALFNDSPVAGLGCYMHAWTLMHQDPPDAVRALQGFVRASIRATQGEVVETDGFDPQSLRDAALLDLVLAYYHAGKPSRFVEFYARLLASRDASNLMIDATTTLGLSYEDTGMGDASQSLCSAYQSRFPDRLCGWRVDGG